MRKWILRALLVALPAAVGAGAWAHHAQANTSTAGGYVCPVTGEELPCPNCCPLNEAK